MKIEYDIKRDDYFIKVNMLKLYFKFGMVQKMRRHLFQHGKPGSEWDTFLQKIYNELPKFERKQMSLEGEC